MELIYEPAAAEDADSIFHLSKALIEQYEDLDSIDCAKVLQWMRRKISDNITDYIRVCHDGQPVAYYRLCSRDSSLELDDLYVLPQFRGRGIGTQILHRCCNAGFPMMLFVFSRNIRAIALYERFGFSVTESVSPTRFIMRRPGVSPQEAL